MKCSHCNAEVPETKYCLNCGLPLLLEVAREYDRRRTR